VVSGGRGVERGRERRVYLGPLLSRAGKDREWRYGRRRLRSVPPVQGRRGADEGARATRIPLQHLMAAHFSGRKGKAERGRPRLLQPSGRRAPGEWHTALPHAVPLGSAASA